MLCRFGLNLDRHSHVYIRMFVRLYVYVICMCVYYAAAGWKWDVSNDSQQHEGWVSS